MKVTTKLLARAAASARGKSPATAYLSTQRDLAARHEAAHAIVAVRLGLHVTELHIQQCVAELPNGALSISNGITEVKVTAVAHLGPTEVILRLMLYAAAPILVEQAKGTGDTEFVCGDDFRGLTMQVEGLDLPEYQSRDVVAWAIDTAAVILGQDDGDAWRLVAEELRRYRFLRSARVVSLIANSDARRARRR